MFLTSVLLALVAAEIVHGFGLACSTNSAYRLNGVIKSGANFPVPANTKIAFLGDNNRYTLDLVVQERAEAVVHMGDFDYEDDADLFAEQIEDVLGATFPYYISLGNHDTDAWSDYHRYFYDRYRASNMDDECIGDIGINHVCSYKGILLVGTAVGSCSYSDSSHADYVDDVLSTYGSKWKFIHHHKNQKVYQLCTKSDETGYEILDVARQHGAIIATGHEHSYARTLSMTNYQTRQSVAGSFNPHVKIGQSFLFCSGLGGESIRDHCDNLENQAHWAATAAGNGCTGYCTNESLETSYGVLFCTFNVGGAGYTNCYFKDRNNRLFDNFNVTTEVPDTPTARADTSCSMPFKEFYVQDSESDVNIKFGDRVTDGTILTLSKDFAIEVTINVNLPRNAPVHQAFLQFFSAAAADMRITPEITISGSHNGEKAFTTVPWETESEDWERHTVWNTNSIHKLLAEILAKDNWKSGDAITFTITTTGVPRKVYSIDYKHGMAPTLAVELDSPCSDNLLQ
jgi:predicted phosphodiesterase